MPVFDALRLCVGPFRLRLYSPTHNRRVQDKPPVSFPTIIRWNQGKETKVPWGIFDRILLTKLGTFREDFTSGMKNAYHPTRIESLKVFGNILHSEHLTKSHIRLVVQLLKNKDSDIQETALEALSMLINSGKYKEEIVEYANQICRDKESPSKEKINAYIILYQAGRINDQEVQQISSLLDKDDLNTKLKAFKVLCKIKKENAVHIRKIYELIESNIWETKMLAFLTLFDTNYINDGDNHMNIKLLSIDNDLILKNILERFIIKKLSFKGYTIKFSEFLKSDNHSNQLMAATIIERMGLLDNKALIHIIAAIYSDKSDKHKCRFLAHYMSGGKEESEILIQWLGKYKKPPIERRIEQIKDENHLFSREESRQILTVFSEVWEESKKLDDLHKELATSISKIIIYGTWKETDIKAFKEDDKSNLVCFEDIERVLRKDGFVTEAESVKNQIGKIKNRSTINLILEWLGRIFGSGVLLQLIFWIGLLSFYKKHKWIQDLYATHPGLRKVTGFGYVNILLIHNYCLRKIIFSPFIDALKQEASLKDFDEKSYFKSIEFKNAKNDQSIIFVSDKTNEKGNSISVVDREKLRGTIVIEGKSGLGKTMFLQFLANQSDRITVFLRAERCERGIIEAIKSKLRGKLKDEEYLESLVDNGYIDIYIDGLNEVSPDTRVLTTNFINDHPKGNYILTIQPIDWSLPENTTTYRIQPLSEIKINKFLCSRFPGMEGDERKEYLNECNDFMAKFYKMDDQLKEFYKEILCNPMDLATVSELLKDKNIPDLMNLQRQKFDLVKASYKDKYQGGEFQVKEFSLEALKMRKKKTLEIPSDVCKIFSNELHSLRKENMVIKKILEDTQDNERNEWFFRHEKIMDFFIAQNFIGNKQVQSILPEGYYDKKKGNNGDSGLLLK